MAKSVTKIAIAMVFLLASLSPLRAEKEFCWDTYDWCQEEHGDYSQDCGDGEDGFCSWTCNTPNVLSSGYCYLW